MDVKDKIVVVTGAAGGLGSATTRVFLEAGAKVALLDVAEDRAQELAAELGGNAKAFGVNTLDDAAVQQTVEQVADAFGAIHACVSFAGGAVVGGKLYGKKGPHPLEGFGETVDMNVDGTFSVMRHVSVKFAENSPLTESGERGVFVNTASIAAYEGQMGQIAYAAGKAGIVGMTLPAARDLSSTGIRVNTIVPGIMGTPAMLGSPEHVKDHLLKAVEFPKRFGFPTEVGKLALHIVENEYLNGECIRIDGALRAPAR